MPGHMPDDDANEVVAVLAEEFDGAAKDYESGDVGDEEDISGQLIGRLKARLNGFRTEKTVWRVKSAITEKEEGPPVTSVRFSGRQLNAKGGRSEEREVGADIVLVLDIEGPSFSIQKGIFIQAKRLEHGKRMKAADAATLRDQCKSMLDISASSYVFLFSKRGTEPVSAAVVEASQDNDFHSLSQYSIEIFLKDFLICWIGDPRIAATDRQSLLRLRTLARARNALLLQAEVGDSVTSEPQARLS